MEKITILHSNDIHGDFLSKEENGIKVGGISYLSGYVNMIRKQNDNVLYAIAGDMFRGSIIDSEYKGMATIDLMNYLSPDIVTLGNHEIDYGVSHLLFLEKCARFPIINANLYVKSNNQRLFKPFKILNVNGIRVMFIGILTQEVLEQTRNEELIGSFIDIWQAKEEIGVIIDNYKTTKVDLTVLLTHIGIDEDKKLAEIIDPKWGVDLIIGGHSHTLLDKPEVVNGIPIVQVGTGTSKIGKIDITLDDNKKIDNLNWSVVDVNSNNCPIDEVMEDLLNCYKSDTDEKYQRIVTTFARELTHPARNQETELGNLFTDLLQVDSSFDVMLYGSGSIRKTKMGPIVTLQDLHECVPYNGEVIMVEVTGKQFKQMMKFMLRDECFSGHTEFYQVSKGMRILYDRSKKELLEFKLNGKDITDEQIIKLGIQGGYHFNGFTDFFGLDVNEVIANRKPKTVITSINSIFEELLSSRNNFDSVIEKRIEII